MESTWIYQETLIFLETRATGTNDSQVSVMYPDVSPTWPTCGPSDTSVYQSKWHGPGCQFELCKLGSCQDYWRGHLDCRADPPGNCQFFFFKCQAFSNFLTFNWQFSGGSAAEYWKL